MLDNNYYRIKVKERQSQSQSLSQGGVIVAKLSDVIEAFIKDMLESTHKSKVEIKRNELANYFGCAPSQINYVLTTRFTMDRGYYVESRRGGGGFILVRRISYS